MTPVTSSLFLVLILCSVGTWAGYIAEKPGECPLSKAKCAPPITDPPCKSDFECPDNQKCCTPFCETLCTDRFNNKPGKCPTVNTFAPCATPAPEPMCFGDADCDGKQKCCDYACAVQCVDV